MNSNQNLKKGYIYIIIAAMLWGTLGALAKFQLANGSTPEEIAFLRLFFGALSLLTYILFTDIKLLKISKSGLILTVCIGLITQTLFNIAYFNAVDLIGVASSAIMLYTAPLFLLVWSVIIFKEKLTTKKIVGVFICILGSFLAITGGDLSNLNLSIIGVTLGMIAAISYSIMSVFSKISLANYNPFTIIFYSFVFGAIFMLPFINLSHLMSVSNEPNFYFLSLGLGIVPSAMSYIFYFKGISTGIDLSKAGVISILELVVSIIIAFSVFNEKVTSVKIVGILIIILSIIVIQDFKLKKNISLNEYQQMVR